MIVTRMFCPGSEAINWLLGPIQSRPATLAGTAVRPVPTTNLPEVAVAAPVAPTVMVIKLGSPPTVPTAHTVEPLTATA